MMTKQKRSTLTNVKCSNGELDSPWKFILARFFQSFMEFCFPQLAVQIDWKKGYETLDKELQKIVHDAQTGKRIADMLFKIWMKNGEEKWILIHLEIQSQKQESFSHRMFTYNYRTYDRYQKPVVSVALFLDEDLDWRPNSFEIQDPFSKQPFLQFYYRVVKLLDYLPRKKELYERNDLFSLVFLAQLSVMETKKDPIERFQNKMSLAKALLKRGLSRETTSELYKFFDWVMILPDDLMLTYKEQIKQMEEQEATLWETPYVSTFEKVARIEGRRAGLKEGREKGLKEGLKEGYKEGLKSVFDKQLRRRFPYTVTAKHLHLINDADSDTLSIWMEQFVDAQNIEEVFQK